AMCVRLSMWFIVLCLTLTAGLQSDHDDAEESGQQRSELSGGQHGDCDETPPVGPQAQLVGLRLGPSGSGRDRCAASRSADGEFIIRAPLAECGSRFTDDAVLYSNMLLFFPGSSAGDTFKTEGAAVPVLCRYKSSGALRPTWTSVVSVHSAHLSLDFYLSLMTDDWSSERNPPVYFMSEMVNILASIDHHHHHHPPLRLYAGSCVATLTPDVDSHPRYPFIDHLGCFTDSQLSGSGSRFLPRVRDDLLHIQLEPFLFHQDWRHSVSIYITCYLEAVPLSKKDPEKKACSFITGRWRSADGDDHACESCDRPGEAAEGSSAYFIHERAQRSNRGRGLNGVMCAGFPPGSQCAGHVNSRP
uniref:Zona pellucida sperm-binding protein 3 n=1 Tax=Xiphophorus couchianus TaxID=32473 RepID=A0A3B5KPC0_9TELE